jgi:hypothetical protein
MNSREFKVLLFWMATNFLKISLVLESQLKKLLSGRVADKLIIIWYSHKQIPVKLYSTFQR